jgi:hypothetical protein
MPARISSSPRSSALKNRRSRRLIACLTLLSGLLVLCAGLLPSSLSTNASGRNAARAPKSTDSELQPAGGTQKESLQGNEHTALVPEQQSNAQDQALLTQAQSVPMLTRDNAPDIPQCRGILKQEILDIVNAATEDPAEIFEKNRYAHPHMIMMPPPLDCASKLWKAARRGIHATEPEASPELLSLRQNPVDAFFNLGALNASVGSNLDPGNGVEGYQGENSISIDPNNPLHLIAFSNTFYKDSTAACQSPTGGTANTYGTMTLFGSTDGGATWTYNCAPWPATITGGVTGATFWFGSDPALAWDSQGRAYATYMLISQSASASGAAIVVARTSDNGASWQSLGTVVNGIASTTQGNDKEMMAIDNTSGQAFSNPGRIYVIWDAANAEKIAYSDNGAAWTTVNFPSNTGAIGGNVVVGADGTVYAIWSRYNVETIVFSKSTNGGATWTAPQVIATLALQSFGTNNKPPAQDKRGINGFGAIDIDRNPNSLSFGNLYVSFPDFPSGTTTGADINTYVVRSTNGGTSWSSRVKVNDDNFGATQIFPWLAVDQSDGTVNVSWYDSRLDPLNRQTQMVSSRSVDGALSFEANVLVTDGGSAWKNNVNYTDENSADNTAYNGNQYGDYSGIAAFNRQVHPLWTDSRMFFPLADTQSPTRREDNATSVLTYCSAPTAIAAPAVNSSTAPSVAISWSAPAAWGTNATNGTYSVFRDTSSVFPSTSPLASGLTSTSYLDTTGASGTIYYYFIRAKNNCPGTTLTPMSADSPASAAVDYGSNGTPAGILQGTVTAGSSPLSGVVVTAGTFSATTNVNGFYLFASLNAATYTVSASPTSYNPASVNGVVVTDGGTTIQNLALMPVTSASCFTDATYSDFASGSGSNVDLVANPGDVKLRNLGIEGTDQISSPAALSTTNNLSATTWTGQTFRAGVTGSLKKISVGLGLASGTSGTITVEIRNLNGINPGTTVLATTTIGPVTNVGTATLYTTTFATPAAVVSGTSYSVVLRTSVGSTVFGVRGSTAGGSTMANGQVFTTTNSGTLWTAVAADLYFTTYVTPPTTYLASGTLFSGVKDANPVVGLVPRWLTLSWNATTPANTSVRFQAAASNSVNGPFNFVGPDGTAATFFTTNGASLSQFNGYRYLKYQALLSTTDNLITPALNDVTVCFDNDTPLISAAAALSRQQAAGALNSQIASVSDPGQAANTLTVTATPLTGTGVTINNISVDVAGKVTADVAAVCAATNSTFTLTVINSASAIATGTLTVNVTAMDVPAITPDSPTTFCKGGSVTLTSSSVSGNQWYLNGNPIGGATNQAYAATAAGNYTDTVTISGCTSFPSTATTVTVNPVPATPTITPDGATTFCGAGSVTLTSSSTSGNQWSLNGSLISGATDQSYLANISGAYTNTVTEIGCASEPSTATTVTVNPIPATPTITPDGPTTFCTGGSVTLTSSSASGNQWYLNGNPISGAINQAHIATDAGDYTLIDTASGCASEPSTATAVTVNSIPATPTITPGGPTTFCEGENVTLTSSSATGNQWHLNGSPISGATNQGYTASSTGDYTVTETASGCSSPASSATTVNVNPIPATPTITPDGPTTFCAGGNVTLTSSSASGNQWYLNGNPIGGASNQTYIVAVAGDYTNTITSSDCTSSPSTATTVTINPIPVTPTITPGGPTTFCAGGNVTLTSSSASGNQWYLNGNAIGSATNQAYVATASGDYTNAVTTSDCASASSAATTVTVNPIPATPTITPGGPTTFCAGGSVTLTSRSVGGNQWYLNGNPIGGASNQGYLATSSGDYTVTAAVSDCTSSPSAATAVTVNPIPATPTITPDGPTTFCEGSSVTLTSSSTSGNQWYLNGNPIGGASNQGYIATASGDYTNTVTTSDCASAPSAATTVTVNPIPATPTITPGGPATFCEGGSVKLTSSSASGNQWYLNGNPIAIATDQQYIATASGTYTNTVTTRGCTSSSATATTVTVNPIPATPTITPEGPTTFCEGSSVTLTSSSTIGNQWYFNGSPIGGASNQGYIAMASGDYTNTVTTSDCSSATSAATTVTVNPIPVIPTITPEGSTTFCTGGSVTLTSSSASGNQWYLNGNSIGGATNQAYIAGSSGDYTVTDTTGGCSSSPSSASTVTVNPIPATPTITPGGPTTFCEGGTVTLTSSSATGNQWYLNGNPIGGASHQTYVATASGDYTNTITTSDCASSPSSAMTVTVNPIPATPTITRGGPTTFCEGGSVTLTSSSATGNQWYLNGNPIGGASNQTHIATATGDYTNTIMTSDCTSAPSAATTVTVNPIPATPTITPDGPTTFCNGGSVTLTSSSAGGNQWYLNGNPIGGATNQAYIADAAGGYTVTDTTSGCSSSPSSASMVTVNPIPATPTITPDGPTTFCTGGMVTLTSSSVSDNQWYLNGNPIGGASNQSYIATTAGAYTDSVTTSGCTSSPSTATTVTVNSIPATPTIIPGGPTTFCEGGNVTLASSSVTGNQWYLNGNPIGGATSQAYIATGAGDYTVAETASGCSSEPSTTSTVTVDPIPAAPIITPGGPTTFCEGGSVTLTSSSATGNQWYLSGNPIGGATNQIYVASASGDYTDAITTGDCASASSTATTVTVNPIPATPTITPDGPTTFCEGGSVTLTSSSTSGNQWYLNGNPIGGATNQIYVASASGDYTNTITGSDCTSVPSNATTVKVNAMPPTPTITPDGPTTFCEGGSVTLTSSSASGNQWYLNGNPIGGATNQTYIGTGAGNYTNTVATDGCVSASSASTTVTVNPIPAAPAITPDGPTTFCNGGSVTLTSNSASDNQWYLNGNPIAGATNQAYLASAPGDYTNIVTTSGCSSAPSTATTVTVNPIPATPTITPDGPTTFCVGGSVTLTSSSASDNQWYLNGNPIGGATNQAYLATASGDYTNTVTALSCSSATSSATTVTINPIPATPTITPAGPTTFCEGGSVTLTSSSASGNQWYLNGNLIAGAVNQTYLAAAAGDYTDTVATSGCASAQSAATTVTANVAPTLTYASPQSLAFADSLTVTPISTGASIVSYAVQSVVPALTTVPVVNASGVVSITNAQAGGAHNITIRATDSCGVTVDASFTLNVSVSTTYSDSSGNCGGSTPCYTTLQAAIDALTTSGTVNVTGGTFDEDVNLSTDAVLNFNGPTTINSLTISGGVLHASNGGSFTLTLATGNWINNGGSFDPGTGTINFSGSGQSIGGMNPTTFNNLTIGAGGATVNVALAGKPNLQTNGPVVTVDETVTGLLILNGDLEVTSPAKLIMPASATSTGTGDVIGKLERLGFVTGTCVTSPCVNTLSLGNPDNQITITAGTAPASILVTLAKSAPATYAAAVQRNYIIAETGGSAFTATLRLHYLDSELNGNTPDSNLNLRRWSGTAWTAVVRSRPVDTSANWVESNTVTSLSQLTFAVLTPTAAGGSISGRVLSDGHPVEGTVVSLSGAQTRKLITDVKGNYRFENVATGGFYMVTPARANFDFAPAQRSFSQLENNTEASFNGFSNSDAQNPLDTAEYFVRQQYVDLMGREPEEGGFNYWSDRILECGKDGLCINARRVAVAAAFFMSLEYQESGSYFYDVYQGALTRNPSYAEFSVDRRQVVGGATLGAQKATFAASFVVREEFVNKYQNNTSAASFIDALLTNVQQVAGVDLSSQRDALVITYDSGGTINEGRALALHAVADNAEFKQALFNRAFVITEYFGYLRRNPELEGYAFWVNLIDNREAGNYRGLVCGFITSAEYQRHFGSIVTHSNAECGN